MGSIIIDGTTVIEKVGDAVTHTFPGPTHTFTVKAVNQPISDSQGGTSPDVSNSTSDQLAIYNGATKLWGINESGWVQQPNVPAFRVSFSGASSSTAATMVVNSTQYNNGSHFDTSNSTFTAPISGYYHFYALTNFSSLETVGWLRIEVNGVYISGIYKSDTDAWHATTMVDIIHLYAGDTAQFKYQGDPDQGIYWFYGGGYYLG